MRGRFYLIFYDEWKKFVDYIIMNEDQF